MADQRMVTVRRRLRPIRLVFVVHPNDRLSLRRVLQINTCLWGGRFNAIIPAYRRTTRHWRDVHRPRLSAAEIASGYLDAFEPDFIITTDESVAGAVDAGSCPALALSEVLNPDLRDPIAYGVDVREVFSDLHRKKFQFVQRRPTRVLLPVLEQRGMTLFGAVCFGEFPTEPELGHWRQHYSETFEAAEVKVEPSNLFGLLGPDDRSPLAMGSEGITLWPRGWAARTPTLFYMDARSFIDLVDLWNLRALGRRVLPVPVQWARELAEDCSRLIARHYALTETKPALMRSTTILCSRSCSLGDMDRFAASLEKPAPDAAVHQGWYPPIWDKWGRDINQASRCDLSAGESDVEAAVTDGRISLGDLSPEFAERVSLQDAPRWATVVRIDDYSGSPDAAPVLPHGMAELNRALEAWEPGRVRAAREGIVVPSRHGPRSRRWRLPTAERVFSAWAKERGFELEISSQGKIAAQVARAFRSLWGLGLLANEGVLKLLNKMAGDLPEVAAAGDGGGRGEAARPVTLPAARWRTLFREMYKDRPDVAELQLKALVARRVLRLGLRLQCPHCSQHTWFDLAGLSESVVCEICLQPFDFPAHSPPPHGQWHYRAIGPFSLGDYAGGAYCVALAVRSLGASPEAQATWIPSFILKQPDRPDIEADFGMFWQASLSEQRDPVPILGECKSYGRFARKDISRIRALGRAFPGAVLAFCTLRKELRNDDKKRLAALAQWSRGQLGAGLRRNPVLVLTGIELFSDLGPPRCWREAGAPYDRFAKVYMGHEGIDRLCDVTQQLHLGMESYSSWLERELEKRRRSRHGSAKSLE